MIVTNVKIFLAVFKQLISPSFWFPFPTFQLNRSFHAISQLWYFRNALTLQANIARKKNRIRELGNYYEFGTFKGNSLITMGNLKRFFSIIYPELDSLALFSFDSFEGLPKSELDHNDPVWQKGQFFGSLEEVKKNVSSYRIKAKYIKGFYSESLTEELAIEMSRFPPSIIFIDADLYSSTIQILKWLDKIALPMSTYIFDDIWATGNHPELGEQKAIIEYNSLSNTRGFLIESPISLGSKTIFSFNIKNTLSDPMYSLRTKDTL